jgi:hypothetical protein
MSLRRTSSRSGPDIVVPVHSAGVAASGRPWNATPHGTIIARRRAPGTNVRACSTQIAHGKYPDEGQSQAVIGVGIQHPGRGSAQPGRGRPIDMSDVRQTRVDHRSNIGYVDMCRQRWRCRSARHPWSALRTGLWISTKEVSSTEELATRLWYCRLVDQRSVLTEPRLVRGQERRGSGAQRRKSGDTSNNGQANH